MTAKKTEVHVDEAPATVTVDQHEGAAPAAPAPAAAPNGTVAVNKTGFYVMISTLGVAFMGLLGTVLGIVLPMANQVDKIEVSTNSQLTALTEKLDAANAALLAMAGQVETQSAVTDGLRDVIEEMREPSTPPMQLPMLEIDPHTVN